jgi:hypothetical protein
MIELPEEVNSVLYKFSNQSLCKNFYPKKFPEIHKARVAIMRKFMYMKVIPRVPFYYKPSERKPLLQNSEATVFNQEVTDFNQKDTFFQKSYNVINLHQIIEQEAKQEIVCNQDPETTKKHLEIYLNNYRNFNQWSLAVNFDFYNFTQTYENITIDQDIPMNYERDPCDMNFREIINLWKYIENIQNYGKWTC